MSGFEEQWIAEFECYDAPGCDDGGIIDMVYQNDVFVFTEDDEVGELIAALGLGRNDLQ